MEGMRFTKSEQITASLLLLFPGTVILCGVLYFLAAVSFHWSEDARAFYGPLGLRMAVIFSPFQLIVASYEVGLCRDLVLTRQSLPLLSWHIICTLLATLLFVPAVIAIFVLPMLL